MRSALKLSAVLSILLAASLVRAEVPGPLWPQWLGEKRDGVAHPITADPAGPKELWRRKIAIGYSAVSVVNDLVYTMGGRSDTETVYCFTLAGKPVWQQSYRSSTGGAGHPGTRSTPACNGKVVITMGMEGQLHCWNAKTGRKLWEKNLPRELGTRGPRWGYACSSLLQGDHVIVDAGPIACFEIATGKLVWKTKDFGSAYSSVQVAKMDGKDVLVAVPKSGLVVVEPSSGKVLGTVGWTTAYGVNAPTPVRIDDAGDRLFVTTGYGTGCMLVHLQADGPKVVYRNKSMAAQCANPLVLDGYVYGFNGNVGGRGRAGRAKLTCVDAATGKVMWQQGGFGTGALALAGSTIVIQGETGELAIGTVSAKGLKIAWRKQIFEGNMNLWTKPVVAGDYIFVRSRDKRAQTSELACFQVRR